MVYQFKEVKEPLRRIIKAINSNNKIKRIICRNAELGITVWDLERASCNHAFKERDLFGEEIVNNQEESRIRDYFQQLGGNEGIRGPYGHVLDIRENFSEMLAEESSRWLKDYVNPARIKKGFEPITF